MAPSRNWYPGHMVATQKKIRDLAPYLTALIEVVDSRAPELTRHRPLSTWVGRTPMVLVLNKAELANPQVTSQWISWYQKQDIIAVALSANQAGAQNTLKRTILNRFALPLRLSVVGMPNLGKSTLLNRMVGKNRVAAGAKPGLTRGPQWIRVGDGWEWLDLPGVVTPSKSKDWRLHLLNVIPSTVDEMELLAEQVWQLVHPGSEPEAWLKWGRARGYLAKGGIVDWARTADALVGAFRKGELGRISLETPGVVEEGGGSDEKPPDGH